MKQSIWIPTVLSAAVLAACGGGGSSNTDSTGSAPVVVTPPVVTGLSLSGVAATGAAIAGKTVEAKCSTGTGTTTSNTDGTYTISVTSGSLPCMLKVTAADGSELYSVATGSGTSATANITPLTQLVVASLTGGDPATYYTAFDSTAAADVTTTTVATAQTAVVTTLTAAGIDASSLGDLVTGTLNAGSNAGYDGLLEILAAALTDTGTTLATLTTTVAATSTTATTGTTPTRATDTASLPADLLLKKAASNCAALRSGNYRVVFPTAGKSIASQYGKITVNASTLALTYTDGSSGTWTANGTCRFTDETTKSDIVVSPAGVIVARSYDTATSAYSMVIGLPEQAHTLAELEGSWNMLGMEYQDATTGYLGHTVTATISATGTFSAGSVCENASTWSVATCTALNASDMPNWTANADGGFDSAGGGRGFAYRAGNGDLMLVTVDGDGSFKVITKQRTHTLPTDTAPRTNWNLIATKFMLTTPALSETINTVQTIDATAGSFTRLNQTVGKTDEHLETVFINNPRDGYKFRAATTVTGTDGVTQVSVTEWTNLGLRGMGLNALIRPAQKQFMFSVNQ